MKNCAAASAAITLTAVLALAGCAGTAGSGGDMPGMNHGGTTQTAEATADANDADIMFATMMIDHHTQAIEMSDMLLAKTDVDPRVVALAERIKAAQQPEIDTMQSWLDAWGAGMSDMGGMDHGGGMMSDQDMQALQDATGPDASRLFLEQMIEHHQGAITMADDQVANGQNPDAVALANKVIDDQTAEIAEMQQLLNQL